MLYFGIWDSIKDSVKTALINAFKYINGQLDAIAYKILSYIYSFFRELSELYLYNEKVMQTLGKRIGLILGIFVLFRLAIAMITYIINPDRVSDSSKGTKKLITNIIFSLILLATVNLIFKEAYLVQKKVVSGQIIEKMFFGQKANTETINLSFYLYSAFVRPDIGKCSETDDLYGDITNLSQECQVYLIENDDGFIARYIIKDKNLYPILDDYDYITSSKIKYTPVISLICAIVAILILLSSCMDVATRIIKLLFLQIIAPIPIISNMVPGKGEDVFKKWYKECINTYLSLFIRIAVISFAVFMVTLMKTEFSNIFIGRNFLIQVLLIIGCLMFAKQTPKLIENLFGIKMEGMSLNPVKKFQDQALFGKNITGFAAGTAVGAMGTLTGAGFGQFVRGGFRGLTSGKGFGETWKNQVSDNATMRTARLNGSTLGGRLDARVSNLLGTRGEIGKIEKEKDDLITKQKKTEDQIKKYETEKKSIERSLAPERKKIADYKSAVDAIIGLEERAKSEIQLGHGAAGQEYLKRKAEYERLKANGGTQDEIANAEASMNDWLTKDGMNAYMTHAIANEGFDASFTDKYKTATMKLENIGKTIETDGELLHKQMGITKGEIGTAEREIYDREQQISEIDSRITTLSGQMSKTSEEIRILEKRENKAKANQTATGRK